MTYFKPAEDGRLLDPCAGEGTAAAALAKALNSTSWGVELSPVRAQAALKNMDRVLCAAWQTCSLTNESITLLFLNPPYNYDRFGDQRRLEFEFLKSATPKLVRRGMLVYIVPHRLLSDETVASILASYYENLAVLRYPGTDYDQVIILGYRRQHYKIPRRRLPAFKNWARSSRPCSRRSPPRNTFCCPPRSRAPAAPVSNSAGWTTARRNWQTPRSKQA